MHTVSFLIKETLEKTINHHWNYKSFVLSWLEEVEQFLRALFHEIEAHVTTSLHCQELHCNTIVSESSVCLFINLEFNLNLENFSMLPT